MNVTKVAPPPELASPSGTQSLEIPTRDVSCHYLTPGCHTQDVDVRNHNMDMLKQQASLEKKRARARAWQAEHRRLKATSAVPRQRRQVRPALQGLGKFFSMQRLLLTRRLDRRMEQWTEEVAISELCRQEGVVDDTATGFEYRK